MASFIFLVFGFTIALHFDPQYEGYVALGSWMFISDAAMAAIIAMFVSLRLSFSLSLKKSAFGVILLALISIAIYTIGGAIIVNSGRGLV